MMSHEDIKKIIFLKALANDFFPPYKPIDWIFKKKKTLNQWLTSLKNKDLIIIDGDINICSRKFVISLKKLLQKEGILFDHLTIPENLQVNGNLILTSGGPLWDNPVIIDTSLIGIKVPYDDNPPMIPKGLKVNGDLIVDAEEIPPDLKVEGNLYFAYTEQSKDIIIPATAQVNGINFKRKRQNVIFPHRNFSHIDIWESDVDNLPDIQTLGYPNQWNWFDFRNSKVERLPNKLKTVYGNLNIGGNSFHYLTDDLTVIGNLLISGQSAPLTNLKKIAEKLTVTGEFQIEGCMIDKEFDSKNFGIKELPYTLEADEISLFNCQTNINLPKHIKCNRVFLRNCHHSLVKEFRERKKNLGFMLVVEE